MGCGGRARGRVVSFVDDKSNRDDGLAAGTVVAGSSEIWPDGVRDLKRWLMWEIVCSGTCQDVSATMCGQASWANGACGPGPAPLFVVECDRSQRLVAHSRLHSE